MMISRTRPFAFSRRRRGWCLIVVVVMMVVDMARGPHSVTTIAACADVLETLESAIANSIIVKLKVQILVVVLAGYVYELFSGTWTIRVATSVPQILGRRRSRPFAHGSTHRQLRLAPLPSRRRVPLAGPGAPNATETLRAGKKVRLGRGSIVVTVLVLKMTLT